MLDEGWSLERIGRHFGRNASTVSYWLKKHGLKAAHRQKHRPKGRIERETLVELVDAGCTLREMAHRLGVGTASVRHWLDKYALRTRAAVRRAADRPTVARATSSATASRTAECASCWRAAATTAARAVAPSRSRSGAARSSASS
jgi:transposase